MAFRGFGPEKPGVQGLVPEKPDFRGLKVGLMTQMGAKEAFGSYIATKSLSYKLKYMTQTGIKGTVGSYNGKIVIVEKKHFCKKGVMLYRVVIYRIML